MEYLVDKITKTHVIDHETQEPCAIPNSYKVVQYTTSHHMEIKYEMAIDICFCGFALFMGTTMVFI